VVAPLDHTQLVPEEAASKTLSPSQTVVGVKAVTVDVGNGFTVTCVAVAVLTQAPVVTVTVKFVVVFTITEELVAPLLHK
jgi:hypothetical protein